MEELGAEPPARAERHLAAILATDVVAYSRQMEHDEVGTLRRLSDLRRNLIEPKVVEHRGRIFKTMGDGFLAEFGSTLDAVNCAVDIQRLMAARNLDLPQSDRLQLRIGINLGDVFHEGDDVFGDGVNIAARLESIAPPGGIYVSRAACDPIRERLAFDFEDLGDHHVKNITRPIQVFGVRIGGMPGEEEAVEDALAAAMPPGVITNIVVDPGGTMGGAAGRQGNTAAAPNPQAPTAKGGVPIWAIGAVAAVVVAAIGVGGWMMMSHRQGTTASVAAPAAPAAPATATPASTGGPAPAAPVPTGTAATAPPPADPAATAPPAAAAPPANTAAAAPTDRQNATGAAHDVINNLQNLGAKDRAPAAPAEAQQAKEGESAGTMEKGISSIGSATEHVGDTSGNTKE